jgi:hypothetical protein
MTHESYYDRLHEIPIETRVLCGELDRTEAAAPSEPRVRRRQRIRHPRLGWAACTRAGGFEVQGDVA